MEPTEQIINVDVAEDDNGTLITDIDPNEEVDLSESEGDPDNDGEHVDEDGNPVEEEEIDPADADADMAQQMEEADAEVQTVAEILESKGIDYNAMEAEFERYGELSPETYDELAKAGYPRVLVDQFCQGRQAIYSQWCDHVRDMAGGDEAYDDLMAYASQNMSPREKDSFDRAVNSGDPETARMAVNALLYRYSQDNPPDGYDYEGGSATAQPTISGYASIDDAFEASDDPRIYTDPEFRRIHELRLMRTPYLTN